LRRIYFLALFIVLVFASFSFGIKVGEVYPLDSMLNIISANSQDDTKPPDDVTEEPEEEVGPDLQSVNLVIVGNIFPHLPQIEQAHIGDGVYDFTPSFEVIAPLLEAADLAIADLETSQAGPDISYLGFSGYTGFPMFNTPQELSVALREAGVDVMTLGNNHALDRGYEGLVATLNHLHGIGIKTFGAYKSQEERDTTLIIEQNGLKIAFIGYTFSTNGIPVPEGHEYCINFSPGFTDTTAIIEDINKARNSGADLIAFFPHWGENEYASEPQPQYYRQVAEELAAAGADLIIGGHPKFIQPIEWFFNERADGTERATLAIYSQGTFLSNQHYPANISPLVEYGLLLDIDLMKNLDSGETWISDVEYEVTWIHREWRHRILPLSQVFSASPESFNLSASKVEDLKSWHQSCVDTAEAYGHATGKAKAMEISEQLINKAHNN
jgi:poly-gamma-glutamate capsule biosynthesis protein CapA/YwtB (metallophosphatase superfamily)